MIKKWFIKFMKLLSTLSIFIFFILIFLALIAFVVGMIEPQLFIFYLPFLSFFNTRLKIILLYGLCPAIFFVFGIYSKLTEEKSCNEKYLPEADRLWLSDREKAAKLYKNIYKHHKNVLSEQDLGRVIKRGGVGLNGKSALDYIHYLYGHDAKKASLAFNILINQPDLKCFFEQYGSDYIFTIVNILVQNVHCGSNSEQSENILKILIKFYFPYNYLPTDRAKFLRYLVNDCGAPKIVHIAVSQIDNEDKEARNRTIHFINRLAGPKGTMALIKHKVPVEDLPEITEIIQRGYL